MRVRVLVSSLLALSLAGVAQAAPASAASDTTPPVLHSVSLASPGPFTAGDTVTVQWDATDDVGIKQVRLYYVDAVGHQKDVVGQGGVTSAQAAIDYTWAEGAVSLRSVWVEDVNGNAVSYLADGTSWTYPGGSGSHTVDLHAAEFLTQNTGQDITPPVLESLVMTTPSSRTAGDPVTLSWTATDPHRTWLSANFEDSACKTHQPSGNGVTPVGGTTTDTSTAVVDQGWANGTTRLAEVTVSDDAGNLRIYRPDGSTLLMPGSRPGPSHSFDLAAFSLALSGTGADTTGPVLTSISRTSGASLAEGQVVSFGWSATEATGMLGTSVTVHDAAGKPHVIEGSADGVPSATIDASWSEGPVVVDAVDLEDTLYNWNSYRRGGTVGSWPSCGSPSTHSFDLSSLDFSVGAAQNPSPTASPTATAAPDATAPTVQTTAFAGPFTLSATVPLRWSASDAGSGVASYDVRYALGTAAQGFGAWVYPAAWQRTTTTVVTSPALSKGASLCLSVRARDAAGNTSGWTSNRCLTRPADDPSLRVVGSWRRTWLSSLYGGSALHSGTYGASVTTGTVTVRRVALVATTCSSCGTVGVYVGGQLAGRISLVSSTTRRQVLLALPVFTARTGVVTVKVLTSGRLVQVDGIGLARV